MIPLAHFDQLSLLILVSTADHESCVGTALLDPGSDVNKDWTCKDKYKDFTYSYLLQVAAKPIQSPGPYLRGGGSGINPPRKFLT